MSKEHPKFLKDENGFCYAYSGLIAGEKHLTPYDGEVDEAGMATDEKPVKQGKKSKAQDTPPPVETPPDTPPADPVVEPKE